MEGGIPRLGLFGGTFDPPHIGHLEVAMQVRSALSLDRVLLIVANEPWQKVGSRSISAPADRLAMTRAAAEGLDGIEVSSIEIDRGGPSFMIDTLEQLAGQNPGAELFLIVGADAAAGLHTWHRSEELGALATLVIVDRPGEGALADTSRWPEPWRDGTGVRHLAIRTTDVSSSQLRPALEDGVDEPGHLPEAVLTYIREHRLYGGGVS